VTDGPRLRIVGRVPTGPLAAAVSRLWYLDGPAPQRRERILPLPSVHVIVNLAEPYRVLEQGDRRPELTLPGPFVSGVQTVHLVNQNPAMLRHVGAEVRPHALPGLTRVPPRDVAGRVLDAEPVLPGMDRLRVALLGETDPDAALDAVEAFLMDALVPGWTPRPRVTRALELMHEQPDRPIASIAAAVGVPHPALTAEFVRQVGLPPKKLAEVYRHVRFLAAIPAEPPLPTWAELAASAGYYDQPHFIRSFARLTGLTPRRYLELRRATAGEDTDSFLSQDS
jgi:AraC-like DNA-binding protein